MKKAQRKDFFAETRKSLNRYFSILLIAALGVAFFSGVRSAEPDMKQAVDNYYDSVNFYNIRLMGTLGFNEDDVASVREISGVSDCEPVYSADLFYQRNKINYSLNVMSLPERINQIELTGGRLPEKSGECLVDRDFMAEMELETGDTITLMSENSDSLDGTLSTDTYTIVGMGMNASYFSLDKGASTIGTGKSNGFIYVTKDSFTSEYYTQLYITVDGTAELDTYSSEYEAKVSAVTDAIEGISGGRCSARIEEVKAKALEELQANQTELDNQKAAAEASFGELLRPILSGETLIATSKSTIRDCRYKIRETEALIPPVQADHDAKKAAIDEKTAEIEAMKAKTEELQKQVDEAVKKQEEAEKALAENKDDSKKDELQLAVDEAQESVTMTKSAFNINAKRIEYESEELAKMNEEYAPVKAQLDAYNAEIQTCNGFINQAQSILDQNEESVKAARAEFNAKKLESDLALENAQAKINESKKRLEQLETPTWYVLDRDTVQSYVEFEQDAERIGALGTVFPAIFFIVASLISLTTMTRMVEEQRVQIGTLKALGYSKSSIAAKYLWYSASATVFGSIIGILLGSKLIPEVIMRAYGIMYNNIPEFPTPVNLYYSGLASFIAVVCTTGAAYLSCFKALREQSAQLMRPAAPKHGKTILLEKIPFIWNHLNFTMKSTMRNLVRYKKRLFMTVFGIAGCMGLLIVGFGLRDSIYSIVNKQYKEIWLYDAKVGIDKKMSDSQRDILEMQILASENVSWGMYAESNTVTTEKNGVEKSVNLFVPETTADLENFLVLKNRTTGEHYSLTDDGVVISEKLARMLGISVGDTIGIKEENAVIAEPTVTAVAENYLYNYVYMTPALYSQIYGEEPAFNDFYISMYEVSDATEQALTDEFASNESITSISYVSYLQEKIETMLKSLDYVVWVLIVSAGLLAVIVLYNLININITERKRELATIKLLGFFDIELAQYVYRENIILTIFGIIFGLIFGKLLHGFVIETVEIDMLMFGRSISMQSYGYAILLTAFFALCINVWMYFRLKKIDMVEALKSVE